MSYADTVLNNFWDGCIPVDVVDIARKLNIAVGPLPNNVDYINTSGIASQRNGMKIIEINFDKNLNRQRFTIAHEIGHHVLGHVNEHHTLHRDDDHTFSGNQFDWCEVEANKFAADLLMPNQAIDYLIKREGITDISDLANEFHVSEQAMYYRLLNLGYVR